MLIIRSRPPQTYQNVRFEEKLEIWVEVPQKRRVIWNLMDFLPTTPQDQVNREQTAKNQQLYQWF